MKNQVVQIAKSVFEAGGRLMLVGGTVRDEFLGKANKDYDCEVYGLEPERLKEILETFGKVDAVGASFAVYKLGQDIDVSIPRREKKVGVGHKGFEVTGDPYMSFEEACSRRDFTINAIMKDPLTGEIVDPLKGLNDLKAKTLRAVSNKTFQEDSLRVLRLAQFASRFDFEIERKTLLMAIQTDLSDLPKERVWMEMEKLFMKSPNIFLGFFYLSSLEIIDKLFPSFQYAVWMKDALRQIPYFCNDLTYEEKLTVIVSVFCYASPEILFDELGLSSVNGYPVRKKVQAILEHMPVVKVPETDYDYHKLSQKVHMKLLSKVIFAFPKARNFAEKFADTIERLGIENEPVKPVVTGRYLIQYGMQPSEEMGKCLAELYDMQLQGTVDSALFCMARGMCGVSDVPLD